MTTNTRALFMRSRQHPPAPIAKPHTVARIQFYRSTDSWLRCSCGKLMRSPSPEGLVTRWRDHRAACGERIREWHG